uniref:Uncharacterized protein n=1 Tax=Peronospora matthiolae TaxID=2874970 RepID=A0AAV1UDX5_9STRA
MPLWHSGPGRQLRPRRSLEGILRLPAPPALPRVRPHNRPHTREAVGLGKVAPRLYAAQRRGVCGDCLYLSPWLCLVWPCPQAGGPRAGRRGPSRPGKEGNLA